MSEEMTRQQRRFLERQEKKKNKNDVLPTALKAVEHFSENNKRMNKINKKLVHLDAEVLHVCQCDITDYLWAVLSKKRRKPYWNESAHERSYFVHYYNVQDDGLYYGHYDLTVEQAREEYHSRTRK